MLPLLNCPKSGERVFKSVSVVIQYFSVSHSQVHLNLKQLSVWPISEAFLLPIVQKKTILMWNFKNDMLIQIVSWPRFSISGEDSSLANFIFLLYLSAPSTLTL